MSSRNFSLRLSLFNAVLFLGSGIQLPFLPLWLKDKGLTDPQIALIVAMTMAVRIIAIPMGTFAADLTQRRRPVIIACAFGTFLAYVLLHFMSGFWPILIGVMLAAALLAPVVPLSEVLAVEGSARFGLDYGRIRLWASLSFLTGSVLAGALLEVIPVDAVILGECAALRAVPAGRWPGPGEPWLSLCLRLGAFHRPGLFHLHHRQALGGGRHLRGADVRLLQPLLPRLRLGGAHHGGNRSRRAALDGDGA